MRMVHLVWIVYLTLPMLISKLWFILGMSGKLAGTKLRQQRLSFLGMHRHALLHAEVAVLVPAANLPHACQEAPAHDSRLLIDPDMRYTLHVCEHKCCEYPSVLLLC